MMTDDICGIEELSGVIASIAIELLTGEKNVRGLFAENGDVILLDPSCTAQIACATAKHLMCTDLSKYEGMAMGGCKQYEIPLIYAATKRTVFEIIERFKADGLLKLGSPFSDSIFTVDAHADQGRRPGMEDRHISILDLNSFLDLQDYSAQSFFGVYDGHGGVEAAQYVHAHLHVNIAAHPEFRTNPITALREGFLATDKAFLVKAEREALSCGATACSILIRGNKLYVAWLGDSQAILFQNNSAVDLLTPHKPHHDDEKKRIEEAGGAVIWYGAWRVNGVLAVARAIGDKKLKQWVIGMPDVSEFELNDTADYIVIGCDGLWDVMDKDKVADFVAEWRESNKELTGIAKALAAHCIDTLNTTDNISIIAIFFNRNQQGEKVVSGVESS